ncbi:hypothetical protein [Micromonospora sp. NPDC093277]|uniref:hypothetical protein n=1 Tax=Micromonospora sp. NPDC093277 TaxID=3364291 RepID=UPI0038246CEF
MTAPVPLESVPFSELLRRPGETTERLSRARAVRLRRRDAGDLVLMSADRAEAEGEVVDLTARILARLMDTVPDLVSELLPTVLPWVRFLPPADIATMARELASTAQSAASIGNTAPLSQLLTEWRHTAEVYADPELHTALSRRPLDDFGSVPRPVDE